MNSKRWGIRRLLQRLGAGWASWMLVAVGTNAALIFLVPSLASPWRILVALMAATIAQAVLRACLPRPEYQETGTDSRP